MEPNGPVGQTDVGISGSHSARPAEETEHIVLATDGSAAGLAAMRWVASRAARLAFDVRIVVVDPSGDDRGTDGPPSVRGEGSAWQAREYLNALAPGVGLSVEVRAGDRRRQLHSVAARADLLVLGTNRTESTPVVPIASLSTHLAESPACPTIVVPSGWSLHAGPVVVGAGGDDADRSAVDFAAWEAERTGQELIVLHVSGRTGARHPGGAEDPEPEAAEPKLPGWLEQRVAALRDAHPAVSVTGRLEFGDPALALRNAGRTAGLIVLGSHELSTLERLLLGSVRRRVLEHPPCPVLVVPPVGAVSTR